MKSVVNAVGMMNKYVLIRKKENGSECLNQQGNWVEDFRKPKEIMEEMCLAHGSTLKGRADAFCKITGFHQKPGILISESTMEIFFPCESMKNENCVWLCFNDILKIHSIKDDSSTEIQFISGAKAIVPFEIRVIRKQMNRCEKFMNQIGKNSTPPNDSASAAKLLKQIAQLNC